MLRPWPELRFRCGERIAAQGDIGSSVFLVRRGVVRLSSVSAEGKEAILALAGPGQVFGESALCGQPSGALAATAARDCVLSTIPVAELVDSGPLSEVVVGLATRLADNTADLERLLHHEARVRLAGILARLAQRHGTVCDGRIRIELVLTQRDLASMVGASRETVNRSLATLYSMGWLHRHGRLLVVDDLEAVRRLAQEAA
jgi:CRP/FNR family transcriptional regulator, cyclic AMP receptor protein